MSRATQRDGSNATCLRVVPGIESVASGWQRFRLPDQSTGFPVPDGCVRVDTTQRQTEQKTELTIHYEFHPWAGESVQLVKRINRGSEPIYRVERISNGKLRRIDIPCWMFDRASCVALVTKDEPLVCIEQLARLRRLLASIANPPNQNDIENEHSPLPSQGNAHENQNQTNSPP